MCLIDLTRPLVFLIFSNFFLPLSIKFITRPGLKGILAVKVFKQVREIKKVFRFRLLYHQETNECTALPLYKRCSLINNRVAAFMHRNQTINRKGAYILADVLAMDNSTVGAATRLFCGFSLK
jgi:hypothetical protein